MALRNNSDSYGSVAKAFHWVVAILIIGLLAVGFYMGGLPKEDPSRMGIYGLHKALGITVLAVVSVRLLWKSVNVRPVLPASMSKIEKCGAQIGHALLYVFAFAMPLSGWAMSSAAGYPVSMFGLFNMPMLVGPDKDLAKAMNELHGNMAIALIAILVLHIVAALFHHFVRKDNVLIRMLPERK